MSNTCKICRKPELFDKGEHSRGICNKCYKENKGTDLLLKSCSIEAEQAVLGGIILAGCLSYAKALKPADFYVTKHRVIFEAMLGLEADGEPIDIITLSNALKNKGKLEDAEGVSYLSALPNQAVSPALLPAHMKIVKEEALKRLILEKGYKTADAIENADLTALLGELRGFYSELALSPVLDKPAVPLGTYLREKHERDNDRDPNKPLGLCLKKFYTLERNIDGIQTGFYIVGADTNTGKTAFLTNLFLDILDANPKAKGIYFSLDDNKDVIINRFIAIKTGLNLNAIQKRQNADNITAITNAYSDLFNLFEEGRLDIKDISEVNHINILEREIKKRADANLFVFIDGLYNLDIGGKFSGLREENIDRANKAKALSDTYKIPIITTGELRKKQKGEGKNSTPDVSDLMETGKFAYNANLVLLLYPQDIEKFKQDDEPILVMDYAKNKLSHYKGYQELIFTRAKGIISEKEKTGFQR